MMGLLRAALAEADALLAGLPPPVFRAAWLAVVAVAISGEMYASVRANREDGWGWFVLAWAILLVPTWPLVARYTDNPIMDSLIFDCLIATLSVLVASAMGCGEGFAPSQWAGVAAVLVGIALIGWG
jgi:hypothetical protein